MKLLSFETKGTPHVGAALDDGIVDLTGALEDTHPNLREGGSMLGIIQSGIVRRKGNSRDMIFDPYTVLAYCSDYTRMEAGDVISLGTFAGNKRRSAGDDLELEIERIGTLRNRVVASNQPWSSFPSDRATGPLVKESR